ncbi:MAG TPA: hypothetical protein VLB76_01545 [Thermoanaerobaculia bacterium]|jgi:hypothetical protein|nr:hypothetical protein [Thermoanaerobaculia bacterium]
MRAAVVGYLAVLQRLHIPGFPGGTQEGAVGVLGRPTLTCDAPLVALALADQGQAVTGRLSHPDLEGAGPAAVRLIEGALEEVTLGPPSGAPLELQILDPAGRIRWYSDPTPGLRSLAALPPLKPRQDEWVYADVYPWIEPWIEPLLPAWIPAGLFLNFGSLGWDEALAGIRRWRARTGGALLAVQISTGSGRTLAALEACARECAQAGASLAVVTGGETGLALAGPQASVSRPSRSCGTEEKDSSGAGAAVSAALLGALLTDEDTPLDDLAERAVAAGAEQCRIAGALAARPAAAWQMEMERLE